MHEVAALVVAIVLIVLLQALRAAMAVPFARWRMRRLGDIRAPAPWTELFEQARRELDELGFEGPAWCLVDNAIAHPMLSPFRAVYRHRASGTWLMLMPPPHAHLGHRLHATYVTRLLDGRTLVSQPFEIYHAVCATETILGQTLSAPTFAEQHRLHTEWVGRHGNPDPSRLDDDGLRDLLVGLPERLRQELLARGDLTPVDDDLATPRVRLALRLLRAMASCPRPPDPKTVPPERLAFLATRYRLATHRGPPMRVQWMLFAVSVLLFVVVGWAFWDLAFALLLLVVIAFHEGGHFLAMRAFGYRNLQMLMLPLIGGVAFGHETTPSPWRRAWMSLMGPLPGILVGWLLVALIWADPDLRASVPHLDTLALLLLVVNYLNVLPVPPLDGSHVVQALLPPRLARLQVGLGAATAVGGGLLAWWLGVPILALLAVLQLPALLGRWRLLGVAARMAPQLTGVTGPARRLTRIYAELDRSLGPTGTESRMRQGLALAELLDTVPMRGGQTLLIGGLYAALAVVPMLGVAGIVGMKSDAEASVERYSRMLAQDETWAGQARALTLAELVEAVRTPGDPAGGASPERLAAAVERLGRPLPDELTALYRSSDGLQRTLVAPIDAVESAARPVREHLLPFVDRLEVWVADRDDTVTISAEALSGWWSIGGGADGSDGLYYQPDPSRAAEGIRVVEASLDEAIGHSDLHAYLVSAWVARQRELAADAAHRAALERLRDASVEDLLALAEAQQRPPLITRWMAHLSGAPIPSLVRPPATAATIDAAQRRVGPLPPSLRALYEHHDGIAWLGLGRLDEVDRFERRRARYEAGVEVRLHDAIAACAGCSDGAPLPAPAVLAEQLAACLDLSWHGSPRADSPASGLAAYLPRVLWCDTGTIAPGWLDLTTGERYRDAAQALRAHMARRVAALEG
ncbi:MAG: hypothetical protein H6983_20780 [Ectothiorhodospiraceae bacterium]|nr:hypothetical protein [Ectothiorhodospiraceae bacterium]